MLNDGFGDLIAPSGEKKGKPNIAPLQPPTLATFRSWGDSAGAGRAGLLLQRYSAKGRLATGLFPAAVTGKPLFILRHSYYLCGLI
jgi:hypothetical protein